MQPRGMDVVFPDVNQPDFLSGTGEKATEEASHGSCAHDHGLHLFLFQMMTGWE